MVPMPNSSLPSLITPSWLRSADEQAVIATHPADLVGLAEPIRSKLTPWLAATVFTPPPSRSSMIGVAAKKAFSWAELISEIAAVLSALS